MKHIPVPDLRAMPIGKEFDGEHWNARLIRQAAEYERALRAAGADERDIAAAVRAAGRGPR